MKINPAQVVPLFALIDKVESRFTLNAILYDGKTAVVTDGHQLTKVTDTTVEKPEDKATLISAEALLAIKKLPKPAKYGERREIHLNPNGRENYRKLECINVIDPENPVTMSEQTVSHPTGNFPDYQRIMPKDDNLPYRISFDARLLVKVLDTLIDLHKDTDKAIVSVTIMCGDPSGPMKIKLESGILETEAVIMPTKCAVDTDSAKAIGRHLAATMIERRRQLESGDYDLETGKTWEESIQS